MLQLLNGECVRSSNFALHTLLLRGDSHGFRKAFLMVLRFEPGSVCRANLAGCSERRKAPNRAAFRKLLNFNRFRGLAFAA